MLPSSLQRINGLLSESDLVLDVGAWANPFPRANWVIDLMPYETRGLYGELDPGAERFGPETWIQRDICDREPWPFENEQFDFAVCSQTLEDVRDPVWVCGELNRVAKAGYIEVPSRLEEQRYGVVGDFVGWSHHRWLVDVTPNRLEFTFKPHFLHANPSLYIPAEVGEALAPEERVQTLFWEGGFASRERVYLGREELVAYLEAFVDEHRGRFPRSRGLGSLRARARRLLRWRSS